ncbi:MAG: nucleoid occlusion protein [Dethiobacter sp.]|nr:nucleoid occlusion protein [Dethiobacter sp.]MCL5980998.1 nucleoid occlusion protein [Bacillota bacterium]
MSEAWHKLINIDKEDIAVHEVHTIELEKIRPNPYQPRQNFSEQKILELAQSIKTYGLLQPVVLRKRQEAYQLIAGERRLRACRFLGWTNIPAVVREASDSAMATIALIENLQRESLNFLEEANAYRQLLDEFRLTQEVIAQRLGKSQSTIANKLRLLKLPEKVQELLLVEELSERHARALLKLPNEELQLKVVNEICYLGLTVSQTDKRVEELLARDRPGRRGERKKVVIRDVRIFLNSVRQGVAILRAAGLETEVTEEDCGEHLEIHIRLPKKKNLERVHAPT